MRWLGPRERAESMKREREWWCSPLRKSGSEGRDLPRENGELSSDVHSGEIVSRVGFRVAEGLGGVDDGGERGFGGNGSGRRVVVEDVRN